jgi:tripartite ATP-independent transporter DctP family solute receptor
VDSGFIERKNESGRLQPENFRTSIYNPKQKEVKMRTKLLRRIGKCFVLLVCMSMIMVVPGTVFAKKLTLRFAHSESTTNIRHETVLFYADRVKELSGGEIEIQIFPSGQMGTHTQCQEMVSTGALDFYPTTAGLVSVFDSQRSQELIELPYLFDNYSQAYAFMDTDFVTKIYEPLQEKGIYYLATWDNGFRHLTNNKRPVYTPADMKGLKVRVVKSEMSIKILSALGANAVPMAYSELYTALGSGVVDGQENPFMNIYASKFYEVQKYMSVTKHQYSTLPIIFSKQRWDSLNDNQRAILKKAALEAATFMRKRVGANEDQQRKAMEEAGMKINDVPDLTPFRQAVQPVYDWAKEKWGAERVEEVLKKVEEIRAKYPQDGSYFGQ